MSSTVTIFVAYNQQSVSVFKTGFC